MGSVGSNKYKRDDEHDTHGSVSVRVCVCERVSVYVYK